MAIEIEMSQLRLDSKLLKLGPRTNIFVEVDMPGSEDGALERSQPVAVRRGNAATIGFQHSYAMSPGSELRKAVASALRSDDPEDSEVQFVVMSVDRQGCNEAEVGVVRYSLEGLLSAGADLPPTPLPVLNAQGAEVGRLTCTVGALGALRCCSPCGRAHSHVFDV